MPLLANMFIRWRHAHCCRLTCPPLHAPFLSTRAADVMPPGLGQLTQLEGLWIVTQMPLHLPTSLGQSLQGLNVIGKGFREEQRDQQLAGLQAAAPSVSRHTALAAAVPRH